MHADAYQTQLPSPGEVIAERYELESVIGHGGFGAVFRGRNLATGRAVAIKWLLPQLSMNAEAMGRFLAEARVTARIEHPNVVSIYDVGKDARGSPFIVMELLRGESLRARLQRVRRIPPGECLRLLLPALEGVAAAHREGVIHRDLKPDNIFLCTDKEGKRLPAKVVDFGISKLFDGDAASMAGGVLTHSGMTLGTPQYMAPEQLNAPKHVDERFDVYALGIVLYEVLAGRPPYAAEGLMELVVQIASGQPLPIRHFAPDVHPALEEVVLRAMHREIDQRWPSVRHLMDELMRLEAAGEVSVEARNPALAATLPITSPRVNTEPLHVPTTPFPGGPPSSGVVPRSLPVTTPLPTSSHTPPTRMQSGASEGSAGHVATTPTPTSRQNPSLQSSESPAPSSGRRWGLLGLLGGGIVAAFVGGAVVVAVLSSASSESSSRLAPANSAVSGSAPATPAVAASPGDSSPAAPQTPSASPSVSTSDTVPRAELTYALVSRDPDPYRGREVTFLGQVYDRTVESTSLSDVQIALIEGCESPPCVVWVTVREGTVPALDAGIRVTGVVLGSRRYTSAEGTEASMLEVDASSIEPLEGRAPSTLSLPDEVRRRRSTTVPRPRDTGARTPPPVARPLPAPTPPVVAPRPLAPPPPTAPPPAPSGRGGGFDVRDTW